jgi:flavin-dependent dehydrogenase
VSEETCHVIVIGGGPAGLAAAIEAARRGLATIVLERSPHPPDKACGEGVMPRGVRWLEARGVRALISAADCSPLESIRWIEADGTALGGRLPAPGGLGVRRTALTTALAWKALECGADVRFGCPARGVHIESARVIVATDAGVVHGAILVGADGLGSEVRRGARLDDPPHARRRFGLRQHLRLRPWSTAVEVHLAPGIQAYVTPAGESRVGVAFLWEPGLVAAPPDVVSFLGLFPRLAERLAGAEPDSKPRGAGPLAQRCTQPVADRVALIGDAAGFVDAITGEGLALAFTCAEALGECLPQALADGASREVLTPYALAHASAYRRYAFFARGLLAMAGRPRLRRAFSGTLRRIPGGVDRLVALATS